MFRVLLVDDETFFRQGLKELIDWESCGFVIFAEADNGEDALAMTLEYKPDVVITDISMPVMDGLELIRQATKIHDTTAKFIIISGYDEFNYAQQAIRYGVCDFLLKPIDEAVLEETLLTLRQTLEQQVEVRERERGQLYSELIAGCIQDSYTQEQMISWQSYFEQQNRLPFHYLLVEKNESELLFLPDESSGMGTLHEEINAFCEQYFPDVLPLPLYEHRRQLGMIVAVSRLPKAYSIEQFSRLLQQKLQQCHKGAIHVYVGEQVAKLSDLRQAYITAKDATMYKYLDPTQVIFIYDQLKSIALRYMLMETQYYHQLSEAIEEQQEEKLLETVEHVFQHFSENRYVPEAVRTSLHRCVSNALEMLGRMEVDIKKMVYHDSMTTWYDRNLTISTLKQLFTAFVKECSQLSLSKRKELSKGRIQKIKNYVDENYATKISLKSVAARFYMSPVYLGQLFRKTYGIYFIDHVLQLRVAEAKRLLRQTDMRVYEIAERVGFNNTEYFVSQFEKMEEMTPTEYRTRLIK